MDAVEARLRELGIADMTIGVIATNSEAIPFYERRGAVPFLTQLIVSTQPAGEPRRRTPSAAIAQLIGVGQWDDHVVWDDLAPRLAGELVVLEPLSRDHLDALFDVGQHAEIWEFWPFNPAVDRTRFESWLNGVLHAVTSGTEAHFATLDAHTGHRSVARASARCVLSTAGWRLDGRGSRRARGARAPMRRPSSFSFLTRSQISAANVWSSKPTSSTFAPGARSRRCRRS